MPDEGDAMTRPPDVREQALKRFVQSRAADFGDEERRDLDTWLADDVHRREYARLEKTWTTLDGLAGRIDGLRPRHHGFGAIRAWPVAGALAAVLAVFLVFQVRPDDPVPRRFETAAAEHRQLTLADGTTIAMNAESAVDLVDGPAPRVLLLRGDVFIDVRSHGKDPLEVRVGVVSIRDIGTRFAVTAAGNGGSVAVEQGMVELNTGHAYLMVRPGRQARFDSGGSVSEDAIVTTQVAPWREQRWHFDTTPLSVLAAEMARQQRIQVDIADPADAALTVSGTFGFAEPQRVLWAAAQVHGLKLRQLGERHFSLQRTK